MDLLISRAPPLETSAEFTAFSLNESNRIIDALFLVAQHDRCAWASELRLCAFLCRAMWIEEVFWSAMTRVHIGHRQRTRLMAAAAAGNIARVRWLAARGAPIDLRDRWGWTAFYYAASSVKPNADVLKFLLTHGCDVNMRTLGGSNPLIKAASLGCEENVQCIIDAGASLEIRAAVGKTALHVASHRGRIGVVRSLLKAGADLHASAGGSNTGWTPLIFAAQLGHTECVEMLLSAGAIVDVSVANSWQAIHWASSDGLSSHADLLRLLLQHGACHNARTDKNETPLALACKKGFAADVRVLIEAGADACLACDIDGESIIHAAASGDAEIMDIVWRAGADLNALTNGNWTPLHRAVHDNKIDIVRWLIAKNVNLFVKTLSGRSAIDIAYERGHENIVDTLRAAAGAQFRG